MDTVIAHRCAGVARTHIDTTNFAEGAFAGEENFESVPTYSTLDTVVNIRYCIVKTPVFSLFLLG